MLKHKSFVLNNGKRPRIKNASMAKTYTAVLETQIAEEIDDDAKTHYDDNEKISLELPQSLCLADEELKENPFENDSDSKKNDDVSQSKSYYSYDEDDEGEDDYSDANAYFDQAQSFSEKQTPELVNEEHEDEETGQVSKKEQPFYGNKEKKIESHDAVVMDNEDNDGASIVEQDKKFEEDIKAILTGKKQFDKERVQKNPEEALKYKHHGQNMEDKLKNDHAIFDKIAQSMQMASSYDLGSIAMDKKFDTLEKETDKDFSKNIVDLLEKDKQENNQSTQNELVSEVMDEAKKKTSDESETDDIDALKRAAEFLEDKDSKVDTKDFLNDLDKLKDKEKDDKHDKTDKLSKQSSFDSTISIKQRYLKSRIFAVSGSSVEVMINSHWIPTECSELKDLNVTLTKSVDYWPDSENGTKKFRIGGPDTKSWNNLDPGNYYLTFYFVNDTSPHCELTGTVEVKA